MNEEATTVIIDIAALRDKKWQNSNSKCGTCSGGRSVFDFVSLVGRPFAVTIRTIKEEYHEIEY